MGYIQGTIFRRTAVRGNLSLTHTSLTVCGRGDFVVVVVVFVVFFVIVVGVVVAVVVGVKMIIIIIIKVSGLKASIDAALGRIFEIDGQNAEEEARLSSAILTYNLTDNLDQ